MIIAQITDTHLGPADAVDPVLRARAENLTVLTGLWLKDAALDRPGRHPEFGAVTLGQLLATWVVHDHSHIRQIARVLAKQYAASVGPWGAYLPVLAEPR